MSFVGLEGPKSQFMAIKRMADTARRQGASLAEERFGAVFMGGPGSGKSTVAELYAQFLPLLGVVPHLAFEQTTGARLAAGGVAECRSIIKRLETTGGVIFIDGAHEMVPDGVNTTFSFLMDEVRRLQGEVVFLFAGPRNQMQSFMGLSPSFRSHVPYTFSFDDFTDGELHQILVQQLNSKFQGRMRVEGGMNGVFMRIVARRIGRGRGSDSFANARDVQNALSRVLLRQADRLSHSRRLRKNTDDMILRRTDLIGPPPTSRLENSTAWKNLQDMTGLASVKKSIRALITRLQTNYDRELAEEPLLETSLNKVFLGGPGTGKTTVAKYYAEILTELGLLSNGEVMVRNCSDFFGKYWAESELLTKAILDSAQGRVLIIDEAYGLARDRKNMYSASVIDTIVAKVQSTSNEDRAVLLLGYRPEMEDMFRRVNPGLARRFPISSAFEFEDFSGEEIRSILDKKLQAQGFIASEQAKQVAMEVLNRSRNRHNFGNAGEVDIILDRAKAAQQMRFDESEDNSTPPITELEEVDFDADYDRRDRAESNIQEAFANLVGAEALVEQFQAYQRIVRNSKDMGLDPKEQIPFNFIFRGPPGTGKTTAAGKLGRIFFDMGFLATTEVEICSANELIGEYVGETGPKTQRMFDNALGKVLFIDEAYRLGASYNGRQGARYTYGKEAVDEIVNLTTHPRYKNRLVVVLAGYDRDINHLLTINPGFRSRFSEVIEFPNLSPKQCQGLLVRLLQDKKLGVSNLNLPSVVTKVQSGFQTLSDLPDCGNARDVENLAKSVFCRVISSSVSPPCLDVAVECVYDEMEKMITERRKPADDALVFSGELVETAPQLPYYMRLPSHRLILRLFEIARNHASSFASSIAGDGSEASPGTGRK
ncbi:ATPases of the AAA+ class [Diaporthe sp. PMI_573]|nr:ATPases of the AAA+ class [Diaporthaceae sp. PMI_573]